MSCSRRSKKRPCRICRKWFAPNPRVGDRQKTCGAPECKKKWHAKKCAEWNRKHRVCFKESYLSGKLRLLEADNAQETDRASPAVIPAGDFHFTGAGAGAFPGLPRSVIQEVIGMQQLVIIEYVARLLFRSVKEVIRA